jgi:hypothetical protein
MRIVRSRLLLGVGAWLLGATSATAGSLYAVGALGNSLFEPSTTQLSVQMVNAELAHENSQGAKRLPAADKPPLHEGRESPLDSKAHGGRTAKSSPSPSQPSGGASNSPAGVLLTSPDGNADAVCESTGAYLLYWSPQPGFEVDQVNRGPTAVASVVFRGDRGGILMKVSCQGGVPVKKLSDVGSGDDGGPGHDE